MKHSHRLFLRHFLKQLLMSAIPILLLGALAFNLTYYHIYNTAADTSYRALEQSSEFMRRIMVSADTIETTFNPDAFSGFSLRHIIKKKEFDYSSAIKYPIFASILNSLVNADTAIDSAYLYWPNDHGNVLVSNQGMTTLDRLKDNQWVQAYEAFSNQSDIMMDVFTRNKGSVRTPILSDRTPVITIFQKIRTLDYLYSKGVAVINIKPEVIQDYLIRQISFSQQRIYLFTNDWELLVSSCSEEDQVQDLPLISAASGNLDSHQTSSDHIHLRQDGYTISVTNDTELPFIFASVIPDQQLYAVPQKLLYTTGLLVLFSCAASLILAAAYSKSISRNIHDIMDIFSAAQNGQPLPPVPAASGDEQSYIINNLISTFVQQEYLTVQLSEKMYHAKTLELIALQAQINPHFLFNTLETIRMKSFQLTGGSNDVSMLIENLSDIMRYSLSDPNESVLMEQEIAYSKAYLQIQNFRYKDRFHVIWEYDEDVLQIPVIKLLIQPLLENAIHHGIGPSDKEALIKIKCFQRNGRIYLHIIDTGIGMTKEQLHTLKVRIFSEETSYSHIGLTNTWKRLSLIHGDQASIHIRSKYGSGTSITLIFPCIQDDI